MDNPIRLQSIRFCSIEVTQRTRWVFVELFGDGITEVVEITSGASTGIVVEHLKEAMLTLKGVTIEHESDIPNLLGMDAQRLQMDRPMATTVSCLRSAITGLRTRQNGIGLIATLGGEPMDSVPVYANINRSLLGDNRSPEAFARAGQKAADHGFVIFKCAPFDDIASGQTARDLLAAAKAGIARVSSLRSAVGPHMEILVDCHSRFDQASALAVAEELAGLGVGWFEEPLAPEEDPEGLAEVSEKVTMPVAGGEIGYGEQFFTSLITSGAISIAMPDVKYCGGVTEACRIGHGVMKLGGRVSLHSPSGPVSQLASACVTAAISGSMALEHAVDETPWRADIMDPPERIEDGRFWFPTIECSGGNLNVEALKRRGAVWES